MWSNLGQGILWVRGRQVPHRQFDPMFNSFDKIRELLALVTDETPEWQVAQYWGTENGWRTFGTGMARAKAERRATLVARIIPEKYTRIRED